MKIFALCSKYFLVVLCAALFLARASFAQYNAYGLWFYPPEVSNVYGIGFSLLPKEMTSLRSSPSIYGLHLDVSPTGPLMSVFTLVYAVSPEMHSSLGEDVGGLSFSEFKKINGLSLGFVNIDPLLVNGLNLNMASGFASVTNGISIAAVFNKHYIINGVTIAVFGNHDQVCRGLQLALINSCEEQYGIQIGLWNKNQKRSLPLINWNLTK